MDRTDYDTAFSCPVCLSPSQSMVFGLCQHFVCSSCLYEPPEQHLKAALNCCPICKAKDSFPEYCPDIPDTTKQLMNIAGVVKCPRKRCGEEMWTWEEKQHETHYDWQLAALRFQDVVSLADGVLRAVGRTAFCAIAVGVGRL
ncbi:hypothetical protein HPB50_017535 [Hyalomma asiaticum]|uniref:Uncharacterized protein n=1 Tax=Hyalomma asiaticum TaxID=266040 RepID=A0ACB7RVD8_HYAAI|nr:hypothetical protein HPB50_017535 [Hyalomma asiaticum]